MKYKFTQETTHHGYPHKRVVILERPGGDPDRAEVRLSLDAFTKLEPGAEFRTLEEFEKMLSR